MTSRGAWSGILLGFVVGALAGVFLWQTRTGRPLELVNGGESVPAEIRGAEAGSASVRGPADQGTPDEASLAVADSLGADPLTQRGNAIVRATRLVAPAVVSINVIQQQAVQDPSLLFMERLGLIPHREYYRNIRSMGSGVIVSADGLVVTNQHVVQGAVQIVVTLSDGRQLEAHLLDAVERYDLAILQVAGTDLPVAPLASYQDLQIGEWAIAIGSPFGYLLADTQPTVTVGVISATNRDIKHSEGERVYLGMIQTDAAINPGNSGGPLVNTRGEVIGINTFIFSESGGSVGIGFAVPVDRVQTVIDEVRRFGRYRESNLGFTLQLLSPGLVQYLGLEDPVGALVREVVPGSPAWKAGLRPGDVLRTMEGMPLDNLDSIYRLYYHSSVGDRLEFEAERDGRRWQGEIVLEEQQ
ncbi:MAG: S1C family serine protease [Candidatus Krumholzibacteriia bacterium]